VPNLVAIDLPGGDAFVAALRTVWDRGDAALPLDQRIPKPAQEVVLDHLRPARIIDPAGEEHQRPHAEPTEPHDALVLATSGTTGTPKGVVLTHAAVQASAAATTRRLGVDPGRHRWLACLPLNHVGGLSVVTRSLITETPVTVLPGFDAEAVKTHAGPDVFVSLVTTALQRIDPAIFHTIVLGGSTPPADPPPNAVTTYGLTETGSGVVYDGVPLDHVEIRIDPATSEIWINAPMLLRAYRDGTDPKDPGGWFATGDSGHLDAHDRLHVDGRLTDMIVTGGENVWPAAIEAVLRAHPKVHDLAVAGRPDPEWGQRVAAWVVPRDPDDPPTLKDLKQLAANHLAPFAAPKELILVDELPKTSLGKVRREALEQP
jgi:O-succinylbenzoic acid--CoA ligase